MSSICVEYINQRASHHEWPASPDRLFQTMVATAYALGKPDQLLPLLESCCIQYPKITAPPEPGLSNWTTSVPVAFMPSNGKDRKYASRALLKQSTRFLAGRVKVWYHWDLPDECAELIRSIRYLGKREDLARCWIDPEPPPPNLIPAVDADHYLSVPLPGRLAELQAYYQLIAMAPQAPLVGYGSPVMASPWGEMLIKRPGVTWSLEEAQVCARCFSRALLSKFPQGEIPSWVHIPNQETYLPHLACVAIPEIGAYRNINRLVGVGVILPKSPDVNRNLTVRKLSAITDMPWDNEDLASLKPSVWCKPSTNWETVTPVVFPRHGKKPGDLEAQLIALFVAQGYPPPEEVELAPGSVKKGIPPAKNFIRRNIHKPVFHAKVRWTERQAGPVLIGLEAHYGLGLFIPSHHKAATWTGK